MDFVLIVKIGWGESREKDAWGSAAARVRSSPALYAAEHSLDPVSPLAAALVMFDCRLSRRAPAMQALSLPNQASLPPD